MASLLFNCSKTAKRTDKDVLGIKYVSFFVTALAPDFSLFDKYVTSHARDTWLHIYCSLLCDFIQDWNIVT
jgi:hypothetical protein